MKQVIWVGRVGRMDGDWSGGDGWIGEVDAVDVGSKGSEDIGDWRGGDGRIGDGDAGYIGG